MENLSQEQAGELKAEFLVKKGGLAPEVQLAINGVGLCAVSRDPLVYGVKINLRHDIDRDQILYQFPEELHENVRIEVVGEIRPLSTHDKSEI